MLPIYNAIGFQQIIDKGARNKPWVVLVDKAGIPTPYVVKLFKPQDVIRYESVANEVIGSVLAKEFGLLTPEPALVEFDDLFPTTINRDDAFEALELADDRIKFGCEYISNLNLMSVSALKGHQIRKFLDIDSVFAFDVLIRNGDRSNVKPNLLTTTQSKGYLIDHELGFNIDAKTADDMFRASTIPYYSYGHHLFLNHLKNSRKVTKNEYFNEFDEYLRYLNINSLEPYLHQLNRQGYPTVKHKEVLDYLKKVKSNHSTFVNLLKGVI